MKQLAEIGDLKSRNELVSRIHELNQIIEWGFIKGEEVERRTGRGWERDTILHIEANEFKFRTVVLPHQLVRKKIERQEQLSFLQFGF